MPPFCLTIRLALLNLATLAMVSAARHLRPRLSEARISTSIGKPTRKKKVVKITLILLYTHTALNYKHTRESTWHVHMIAY